MGNADRSNQAMIDQGEDGPVSPEDLADSFRTQSYHLMELHPIVGAHLVLAAASLAPTCDDERDVAEEFSDLIAEFAIELRRLHARTKALRMVEAREVSHGTC
ncbi:hypothetical protein [Sphingomonas solaris]|uniref:Uncharacterized protein n=1 Tax=Alterirhizorhabdus solaris TaxID=2529389 RepID=A0A558RAL7_9SPHN|nr:hypothetical protein [Sphingomonas solaris]TVV76423.1 hypothetical protein FOY91_04140 [Sphingomonas solaris]